MKKLIGLLVLVALVSGCATTRPVPTSLSLRDYTLNASRQKVFDVALAAAQIWNLDVAVLEKQSGLIRFENASLSPAQLDKYCVYPFVNADNGKPWQTFTDWNNLSSGVGGGFVLGKVSLTLLVSENGSTSNVNLRSNWVAFNRIESYPCNSNGKFEEEFITDLKKRL